MKLTTALSKLEDRGYGSVALIHQSQEDPGQFVLFVAIPGSSGPSSMYYFQMGLGGVVVSDWYHHEDGWCEDNWAYYGGAIRVEDLGRSQI